MMIWGKILGAILGLLAFRHPIGAIIGLFIGHLFDKAMSGVFKDNSQVIDDVNRSEIRSLFMQALFTSLGYIAKADGRVSEAEIAHTEQIIKSFGIDNEGREEAIGWFQEGVKQQNNYDQLLQQFAAATKTQLGVKKVFIETLIGIALADGKLHPQEEDILMHIAVKLGVPEKAFEALLAQIKAQYGFAHQQRAGGGARASVDELAQAYQVLGVSKDISDDELKKAYRKLMSENHPDKLMSQGVPEHVVKKATEKAQTIQAAYELIKKHRKK